jgi:hypothetical protein
MKHGILIRTLGALALGVLCSCATDDTVDPFPQDRNITALLLPEIDSMVADSIEKGTYPESLSGWELRWSPPLSEEGAQALYILGDSLPAERKAQLVNGAGDLDFGAVGLATPLARLSVRDSVWRIPKNVLGGRGKDLRTDTVFWFSVWIRYADGAIGPPVSERLFLGDEFPPEIPSVDTIVGQTSFTMLFERPRDLTSRFDREGNGTISRIRTIFWEGIRLKDSAILYDAEGRIISRPDTLEVSQDSLRDTTIKRFRLDLTGLAFNTSYMALMQLFDDTGNVSTWGPFPINTRDERVPSPPGSGSLEFPKLGRAVVGWSPSTDSFSAGAYQASIAPNHRIRTYRTLLSSPAGSRWRAVDSLDLYDLDSSNFRRGVAWEPGVGVSRFSWNGSRWSWAWPNLSPGDSFRVAVVARDRSGNPAADTLFISGKAGSFPGISCPAGKSLIAVQGDTAIQNFCIERFEHSVAGATVSEVTWSQAADACQDAGGELCSEFQWQRACETAPDTTRIYPFGAVETGLELDTLGWLESACGLGGGPGDSLAARDTSRRDPRCISGWGVRDMPGQLAEWTRDVWHSRSDTLKRSQRDAWSGAYLGASDYTGKPDLGVLHGGSWLDLANLGVRKNLARCRGRTYPATSATDTLSNGRIGPVPDPDGRAKSWGFRCCYRPLESGN